MRIFQIFIRNFWIFPLAIVNCRVKKFGFEHKVWWFFNKTRNTEALELKTNYTTRK